MNWSHRVFRFIDAYEPTLLFCPTRRKVAVIRGICILGLSYKKASESFSKSHLKESTGVAEKITSTDGLQYAGTDLKDLIENLEHTTLLHEQVDIIHYLYFEK